MTDLASAVAELKASIDSLRAELVRRDVYESDQRGMTARVDSVVEDVREVKRVQEKQEDDRKADRRLLIAAFVSPLLLLVIQLYLNSQGAA